MRVVRHGRGLVLVSLFVLGPAFACADSQSATPPVEGPSPSLDGDGGDASVGADAKTDAYTPNPRECTADGFCYVPVPGASPLTAVSASSPDDAWMLVENSGALLRWNGSTLEQVFEYEGTAPSSLAFAGLWARKKDDVWAIANGDDGRLFLVRYASPPGGGSPTFREFSLDEASTPMLSTWAPPDSSKLWLATGRDALVRIHESTSGAEVETFRPTLGGDDTDTYSWRAVWGFAESDVWAAGQSCGPDSCDVRSVGVLGHYDGASWTIHPLAGATDIQSLRGTAPGADRRLWFDSAADPSTGTPRRTHLVEVTNDGMGQELFVHDADVSPSCSSRVGQAVSPSSGWFSDGLVLCRWTGTQFEPAHTTLGPIPVVASLDGIWADGTDDVWIVGKAVTRSGLPQTGFAARRTAQTATEGER